MARDTKSQAGKMTATLPGLPGLPGRPATGQAKSGAQRQAAYRAKKEADASRLKSAIESAAKAWNNEDTDFFMIILLGTANQGPEPDNYFQRECFYALGRRMGWI